MTGPVVSLSSHQSTLAVIYHNAAPVLGCQSLTAEFWFMEEFSFKSDAECFKEEFKLALTPDSSLIWAGFSDSGNFFTADSEDVVRCFWKRAMSWVPVCKLEEYSRIVGATEEAVLINPKNSPKLIETVQFSFPLCKSKFNSLEQQTMADTLKHENNKDLDKKKKMIELDKLIFKQYMQAIDDGNLDAAFGLAIQTFQEKSGLLCIKLAEKDKVYSVMSNLAKYFGLNLPSRLARPERIVNDVEVAEKKVEVKNSNSEVTKENVGEKAENLKNPFSKTSGRAKDLFEALSADTKRKPEQVQGPFKKVKK